MSSWKHMASDNISQHPKLCGRTDLLNAMAESGRRLSGRQSKMLAFEVSWKCKNARINSCGYSPAQWVIGRGYKLPWSHGDEKQSGELASLELPHHSPEFGQRMSWLRAARRAVETMDTSHRLRRALLACVRASAHIQGIVNGELVYVWRKVKKNRTDARTVLVTHRWHRPAIVSGKRRTTCLCLFAVV